jgi:CheY-like chemotaxis protein
VRLASEPGAGTTVEVFLPRAMAMADHSAVQDGPTADVAGGGRSVLIVDDDPAVRRIAALFLHDAGFLVREADNGPQARDILATGPVSLALVDYAMPMMSGYEFVTLAREIQPDLPVIYVTGVTDTLGSGKIPLGDPIIMKPYGRASLLKAVRQFALPIAASAPGAPADRRSPPPHHPQSAA